MEHFLSAYNNNNGDGTYNFLYETGNGINAQEQGDARGDGTQAQGQSCVSEKIASGIQVLQLHLPPTASRSRSSTRPTRTASCPRGAHLPTPPPIPEEIQRAIEQNLADEARGVVDDGQYKPGAGEGGGGGAGNGFGGGRGGGGGGGGAPGPQYGTPAAPSPFKPGSGNGGPGGYRY
ncbi:hypothetical protein NQ318_004363 [Aromia moschata]|uniref:Uncharacterized protein n=1 Tax=Aromia moschata TaxID=1265417 RepID=A0AAV8YQX8_9CUCU|nr:hypothetical protein NQ318_004363 [Aromia moschata]